MRSDMPRESTVRLRQLLRDTGTGFHEVDVRDDEPSLQFLERRLRKRAADLPLVFVADHCLGGVHELEQLAASNDLTQALRVLP
jgi:glutaredoxin